MRTLAIDIDMDPQVSRTTFMGIVWLVQKRSGTANLEETQAFMAGQKQILVFSS